MNKELIIRASSSEVEVALLEDKLLVELHREKHDSKHAVGDIYLGRVRKVMPGLNAAFIDVGSSKDAFLHVLDLGPQIRSFLKYVELAANGKMDQLDLNTFQFSEASSKNDKIGGVLKQNQAILVQIIKESISTKGPRLCSEISFAGRYLVLIPFSNKVSISSKIKSAEERNRLKFMMQSIRPQNFGVIIRTVAEGISVSDIDADLQNLLSRWETMSKQMLRSTPPKLVLGEQDKTLALLRDILNKDFNSIIVDSEAVQEEVKSYLQTIAPEKVDIVKLHKAGTPIFDAYNVTRQIKSSFGKVVPIHRGGAYLVVEHTEALHVIDVNSGHKMDAEVSQEENALAVNLESAEEIARQLRLRDMGGIIVVDFIDQREPKNRKILFDRMVELMDRDTARHNVLPPTKFGLVQITRQRVRSQTNIEVLEKCPVCNGTGEVTSNILVIDDIRQQIEYLFVQQGHRKLQLEVNPFIYAYLREGLWSLVNRWQWHYKRRIVLHANESMHYLEYRFADGDGEMIHLS